MTLKQDHYSLTEDVLKTNQWSYQWKILFNPDTSKQAQENFLQQFVNSKGEYTKTLWICFQHISMKKFKMRVGRNVTQVASNLKNVKLNSFKILSYY